MRIAVLSYADVDNYGDKAFPFIVRHEIQQRLPAAAITLVSWTGTPVEGAKFEKYSIELLADYDAVILGGGEILHLEDGMLIHIYKNILKLEATGNPTNLVYEWPAQVRGYRAWVALGAPPVKSEALSARIQGCAAALDHASVRGPLSQTRLREHTNGQWWIDVVPDLGWKIPKYWAFTAQQWAGLAARIGLAQSDEPYVVFQTLEPCLQAAGIGPAELREVLHTMRQAIGMRIVLLPICRCWEDHVSLARVYGEGLDDTLLCRNLNSIGAVATVLQHAQAYVGSSLHGAFTCLAAGIPAGIVYPGSQSKFTEAFALQARNSAVVRSFGEATQLATRLLAEDRHDLLEYSRAMQLRLDRLFYDICCGIERKRR